MYKGKATCKILKEIRKQIAKENDISFVTTECKYQGDCLGTCPACEAEVRYLEEELRKRKQLGKTAIVTGVSLGLATSFIGCHFGGNATGTDSESSSSEPTIPENTLTSVCSSEKESTISTSQKPTQANKLVQMTTEGVVAQADDFWDFGYIDIDSTLENNQSSSLDTIEIISEVPEFEFDGTVSATRLITPPKIPEDVCLHPAIVPQYPQGEDSCLKFIQQHILISPKLKFECAGNRIYFIFTIEKNGLIGQVQTSCLKAESRIQKRWNKRCERAVRKAIKSMPRWIPGKDQDNQPVRCFKSGNVMITDSVMVWLY